jgi:predicted acetyltransferase/ribosomal protein S18 acetylase RimI-like enzyme
MTLRELSSGDRAAFLDYARDFEPASKYAVVVDEPTFVEFLESLRRAKEGVGLPPGYVKQRTVFAFVDGRIVGRVDFRSELTEPSTIEGGNIGYEVRLSDRSRGIGTRILGQFLNSVAGEGLVRVLLTCDDTNTASERVILNNGGVYESSAVSPRTGRLTKRFWIDLAGTSGQDSPAGVRLHYFDHLPPDFAALTRQLDEELADRNGAWQAQYDAYNRLEGIHDVVLAFEGGTAVGCASLKRFGDGVYEVKRVFVAPTHRRLGIARHLMARLEDEARRQGIGELILETADTLIGAQTLYVSLGYRRIPSYGQYRDKAHSVCFGKTL